jgi:hypothetical protein
MGGGAGTTAGTEGASAIPSGYPTPTTTKPSDVPIGGAHHLDGRRHGLSERRRQPDRLAGRSLGAPHHNGTGRHVILLSAGFFFGPWALLASLPNRTAIEGDAMDFEGIAL